jgi:hypothetical protein
VVFPGRKCRLPQVGKQPITCFGKHRHILGRSREVLSYICSGSGKPGSLPPGDWFDVLSLFSMVVVVRNGAGSYKHKKSRLKQVETTSFKN